MTTLDDARRVALALPGAVEQPHHDISSFRVNGKIFATVPDEGHVNVMLDEHGIRAAVHEDPTCCVEVWWGRRLAAVRVNLADAPDELVAALFQDAWRPRARP